jgi:hypothetical protein
MNIHQYSSAKIQGEIIVANQDEDKIKSKDAAVMDKNKTNSRE